MDKKRCLEIKIINGKEYLQGVSILHEYHALLALNAYIMANARYRPDEPQEDILFSRSKELRWDLDNGRGCRIECKSTCDPTYFLKKKRIYTAQRFYADFFMTMLFKCSRDGILTITTRLYEYDSKKKKWHRVSFEDVVYFKPKR